VVTSRKSQAVSLPCTGEQNKTTESQSTSILDGNNVGTSSYADVARRAGEMMVSQSNKEHVRVSKKME
jgi:hypothetical protein